MAFTVLYDANVLYGNTLRDLLIRTARSGLVQAEWSHRILDEMLRNLTVKRPDIPADRLKQLRTRMLGAIDDGIVDRYEPLIDGLDLPDQDDRHVLAAAIKSGAQIIVTSNLKDFPAADLARWHIEAKSPDELERAGLVEAVAALRGI